MSKSVDLEELVYEIRLQYKQILRDDVEARLRVLDLAHKFNEKSSDEEIIGRAKKFAEFVFSTEKAQECLKEAMDQMLENYSVTAKCGA